MAVKFVWLVGVLTLTLLVIIETSALDETRIKMEDYQRLKTYDVKGKGKKLKETKMKPTFKKCRDGEHCSVVDKSDETHKDRIKRNASTLNELEDAKKNHKKLKLTRTLSGFKKWTNKELSSDSNGDELARKKINPRHVSYFTSNEERTSRSERYAVTRNFKDDKLEYYAQRKAVMDRFYARQKEIAEKYAKKVSTTPRYIYRYDFDKETDKNNLFVKIKTDNTDQQEAGNAVNGTSYDLETTTLATSTTTTTTTQEQVTEMTTVANRISRSNQDQVDEDSYDEEGDDVEYRNDNNQNIEDWEAVSNTTHVFNKIVHIHYANRLNLTGLMFYINKLQNRIVELHLPELVQTKQKLWEF